MSVKKELENIRFINAQIDSKTRQIEELESRKTSIKSPQITGLPHPKGFDNDNKLDHIMDKIHELQSIKEREIERLVDKKLYWNRLIDQLADDEAIVIELRYFEGLKWEKIASIMHYESRQVYNIHGNALKNLEIIKNIAVNCSKLQ